MSQHETDLFAADVTVGQHQHSANDKQSSLMLARPRIVFGFRPLTHVNQVFDDQWVKVVLHGKGLQHALVGQAVNIDPADDSPFRSVSGNEIVDISHSFNLH